ncbi:hypothetical protein LWI28_012995 [Acer negundo]|uniref:Uncharacterized protein n=1 Tax=Acer negundo TaxID=4023 RepID=A0AAD5NRD2_ACENE|nr:hypothetical protein LWI28_012995 [Acer negundo]
MKAPTEPPLEDGNAPDLPMEDLLNDDPYYVPPVLTVPSLVDEIMTGGKKPKRILKKGSSSRGSNPSALPPPLGKGKERKGKGEIVSPAPD